MIEVIYTRNKNRAALTKREHIIVQLLFCLEIIHSITIFVESVRYIKQSLNLNLNLLDHNEYHNTGYVSVIFVIIIILYCRKRHLFFYRYITLKNCLI